MVSCVFPQQSLLWKHRHHVPGWRPRPRSQGEAGQTPKPHAHRLWTGWAKPHRRLQTGAGRPPRRRPAAGPPGPAREEGGGGSAGRRSPPARPRRCETAPCGSWSGGAAAGAGAGWRFTSRASGARCVTTAGARPPPPWCAASWASPTWCGPARRRNLGKGAPFAFSWMMSSAPGRRRRCWSVPMPRLARTTAPMRRMPAWCAAGRRWPTGDRGAGGTQSTAPSCPAL